MITKKYISYLGCLPLFVDKKKWSRQQLSSWYVPNIPPGPSHLPVPWLGLQRRLVPPCLSIQQWQHTMNGSVHASSLCEWLHNAIMISSLLRPRIPYKIKHVGARARWKACLAWFPSSTCYHVPDFVETRCLFIVCTCQDLSTNWTFHVLLARECGENIHVYTLLGQTAGKKTLMVGRRKSSPLISCYCFECSMYRKIAFLTWPGSETILVTVLLTQTDKPCLQQWSTQVQICL